MCAAELRAPVPDELSEPARFTVTIDAEEKEFDRDEYRWCLGMAEGSSVPAVPEAGTAALYPFNIVCHRSGWSCALCAKIGRAHV